MSNKESIIWLTLNFYTSLSLYDSALSITTHPLIRQGKTIVNNQITCSCVD